VHSKNVSLFESMAVFQKTLTISFMLFLVFFGDCFFAMSQERKFGKNVRPLFPDFLLKEEGFDEVKGRVIKRFNQPSAKLLNLPTFFGLKEYYSLDIFDSGGTFESEIEQYESRNEKIVFINNCSLRYVGSKYTIYLTTSLLPPLTSESVRYVASDNLHTQSSDGAHSVKKITLEDGTESMLYSSNFMKGGKNQLVFIKDNKYYISIASDLDIEEIIKIVQNNLVIE
jgi:Domain of unknown function (DUF4367)